MTEPFDNKRARVSPQDMEAQIRTSLVEVQQRIDLLTDSLPLGSTEDDPLDEAELTPKHYKTIKDIRSIESEWILDKELRDRYSSVVFVDEDGNETDLADGDLDDLDGDDWQWGDSEPDTFDMGDV